MTIVRTITPREITWDIYEQVHARITEGGPIQGLIVHTAVDNDGRPQFIEVWESEEDARRFGEQRLGPVIAELAPDVAGPPDPDQMEIREVRMLFTG